MGFLDKLKKGGKDLKAKADDLAEEHGDKIKGGIDKASNAVEKKMPKQAAKIEKASEKAKDVVDDMAKEDGEDKGDGPGSRHAP